MKAIWKTLPLADFARTGSGGTPSRRESRFYENGTIPWVKSGELRQYEIRDTEEKITPEALASSSAKVVPKGAILIALYGATVGQCSLLRIDAATNQAVCHIIPDRKICDTKFLYFYLASIAQFLLNQRAGGAQPNISQALIKDLQIPLPPLPEQHRIVEILDQADTLRRQRREAGDLSKSILPALFQEMFGAKSHPKIPLSRILRTIQGGWSPVCENRPAESGEWGVLKLGGATYCEYRPQENKALRSDCEPRTELEVNPGDLLFTRKNTRELVGATAYVFETPPRLMTPDLIFRLIPDSKIIDPIYLWQAMIQPEARMMIQAQASGAAASMVNISQSRLLPLEFPVPPLSEQQRFAKAVLEYRTSATNQSTSAATLETLFQTLLHRAFDGSLTAKWREGHAREVLAEMKVQSR